jgi:hypothetical protein
MNKEAIAVKLLIIIASGGTLERTVGDLPMFKSEIESAFEWLKTAGRCLTADIEARANRLRELILEKDEAVRRKDFDLAAIARGQECELFKSFGLSRPPEGIWSAITRVAVAEQTKRLSEMIKKEIAA